MSPHLEPYYDAYAAPYVDIVRPYYNTLDRTVISPAWGYATEYGTPRVEQARAHGKALWESNVQPQLLRYQDSAKAQYDQSLAPHVSRITTTVGPYYDMARTNALQTYYELLLPSYEFLQPYAQQGYHITSAFVADTVVPSASWAWTKTYVFLDGTVWPQLRIIYVENVEPQLVRIGQRLGRHNGKSTSQNPVTEPTGSQTSTATSSFTKPAVSVSSAQAPPSTETPPSMAAPEPSSEEAAAEESHVAAEPAKLRSSAEQVQAPELEQGEVENKVRRTARETVAADLKDWQERYAKAADEGAAEIEQSVSEISKNLIDQNARKTGKLLLEQLQTTVVSELVTLRRDILNIVGAAAKGSATAEEAREQITIAVRRSGVAIKERAQNIRTWREEYEIELQESITTAAQDHFRILDEIRDLALQRLGMKWAWLDGVTYKDWAKYHQLKSRFQEWQGDLENLIVTHPGIEAAQIEGANIEDEAMSVAQAAAKELARLKQVAGWKLVAADDTDEFDSELTRQAAETAESAKIAEAAKAASEDAPEEGIDNAEEQAAEQAEPATNVDAETAAENHSVSEPLDAAEPSVTPEEILSSAASIISESVESASSAGTLTFDDTPSASEDASSSESTTISATEQVPESADDRTSDTAPATAEFTDHPDDATPDLASEASTVILAETPAVVGNVTESHATGPAPDEQPVEDPSLAEPIILGSAETVSTADEPVDEDVIDEDIPVSSTTTSVKPALFGAAAQSVPSREPILDEDAFDDAASVMESVGGDLSATFSSMAHSAYSAAVSRADSQYSQALSVISAQIHGTQEPMRQQMLASVTSAYSNAVATASSHLDEALQAAQKQFRTSSGAEDPAPTPVPTSSAPKLDWSQIESIAAERLSQGRAWAEEQYESAKIAIGVATPTPSTPAEHAEKLLEGAKHNYYAGLGMAHARYSEFVQAASAAWSSMTATPTPTDIAGSASSMASVAGGAIADSWEAAVSQISVQVYGAPIPTPWHESLYSAAGDYAASATSAAGDSAASVTSAAQSYASVASDEAARQYSSISSIFSELVAGKEPTFSESIYSRLDAVYAGSIASATSLVSAAQATASSALSEAAEAAWSVGEQVVSAVSDATDAVKDTVGDGKDEL